MSVVGRGAIVTMPDGVTKPRARTADIGVAVVPIDTPRLENPFHIGFMAGPSHVIDNLVVAFLAEGFADSVSDLGQGFFPADASPLATAARAGPF